jgi:CRP/FNR family cyclic AMP-dependent transcriptional regulator
VLRRFTGHGRARLVAALRGQKIVRDDEALARLLSRRVVLRVARAGERLMSQGDADSDLFLILAGRVAIVVNGRELAYRTAGEHVGEMALIDPSARRSASVLATEDTVVAIVREQAFSSLADRFPQLWRRLAVELGNRLRERSKYVSIPNAKPVVFVGSSTESLPVARAAQAALGRGSAVMVNVWTDGIFMPSRFPIEDLLRQVAGSDFAVLVIGPEDKVVSRGRTSRAPRDNVIFELGLFMGSLGRERAFIVQPRGVRVKIPSDLLGLTTVMYRPARGTRLGREVTLACKDLVRAVKTTGPK